jgi:hypothetical protein
MASVVVPRMTRPWKVVATAIAAFGFLYGYVGAAGHNCSSMGSCLQDVVDNGPAGFDAAALIPGVVAALVLATVVYALFVAVLIVRSAVRRQPAERLTASRDSRRLPELNPLSLALAVASVWALISIGPSRLADDLDQLVPRDKVTAAFCVDGYVPSSTGCSRAPSVLIPLEELPPLPGVEKPDLTRPQCVGYGFGIRPEADGSCHERSGGDAGPLVSDVLQGGQNGLLAFLAVGAALLLWPKLRAGRLQPEDARPK